MNYRHYNKPSGLNTGKPRHACTVQGCRTTALPLSPLCGLHHKRKQRIGSPIHPGITMAQRQPVAQRIERCIRHQLTIKDLATQMMLSAMLQLLHGLPSGLPKLNELRGRTPKIKALAVLAELNRQRWICPWFPRQRTPKNERLFATQLLASCLASELMAPAICASKVYRVTQTSQGVYAFLWKFDLKKYEVENGRGGTVTTLQWNSRPSSLQSRFTAQRLYDLVSECYRDWWQANGATIKGLIPAGKYTPAG